MEEWAKICRRPSCGTFSRCHTSRKSFLLFSVFRNGIRRYQSVPCSAHRSVDAIVCHRVLQTTHLEAISILTPASQVTSSCTVCIFYAFRAPFGLGSAGLAFAGLVFGIQALQCLLKSSAFLSLIWPIHLPFYGACRPFPYFNLEVTTLLVCLWSPEQSCFANASQTKLVWRQLW